MQRKLSFFVLCIFVFVACNNKKDNEKESVFVNNLIAPKSSITYEQEMKVPEEYFFFKSIDFASFASQLQTKTLHKEITAYIPFSNIVCNDEDINTKFREEFSLQEIQALLFDEDWALDTAQFIMKKKVNAYSLVRNYIRKSALGEIPTKSILAKFDFSNTGEPQTTDSKLRLLANDVAYEVPLVNESNPEFLEDIQVKQVVKTIIEKATCGNTKCYSFTFRDSLIEHTLDEVKQSLGHETICYSEENPETYEIDTICVDKDIDLREICGLAFIEDWYVNDSTMEIVKDVKAIAPVRAYYHSTEDTQSELVKSIPFVMYLKNHDKGK